MTTHATVPITVGKGRYQFQDNESGTSLVVRAIDLETNQLVALKFQDPDQPNQLEREANAYRCLQKTAPLAALPRFLGYEPNQGEPQGPFLVLEWIEGATLWQRIKQKLFSEPEAIFVARQICAVVGQLHQRGIIHRDLSLNNVLLVKGPTGNEEARLVDLELALVPDGKGGYLDHKKGRVGTFIAPELSLHQSGDARCDIFSLGEVLKQMVIGIKNGSETNGLDQSEALRLSKRLSKVVRKCQQNINERYQTLATLDQALRRIQWWRWGQRAVLGAASVGLLGFGLSHLVGEPAPLVVPVLKTPSLIAQQEPQPAPTTIPASTPTTLQTPTSLPIASQELAPSKPQKKAKPTLPTSPTEEDEIDAELAKRRHEKLLKAAAQPVIYKPKGPIEVRVDLKE